MMPMTGVAGPAAGTRNASAVTGERYTVFPPGGCGQHPAREGVRGHPPAAAENGVHGAAFQIVQQQEVRQITRAQSAPGPEPEAPGRRPAGGAINRGHRRPQRNRAAHQVVQMALFMDVQRVAVVGAEAQERARRIR